MPVPTYDKFIAPLLTHLAARPDGAAIASVYDALAKALGLSDEDRAEMLPSGAQPVFKNRIGWAQDRLKRAGLSESPSRGVWRLTREGVAFVTAHKALGQDEIDAIAAVERGQRLKPKKDASASDVDAEPRAATPSAGRASPEDMIGAALAALRERVARDLLETIGRAPPDFFEKLVLDLLHRMGYGTDRTAVQRVGGSGDGGIDGIISLDVLGLEKVYVQAKRWKNPVGSPEIQGFMGALQLQAASKGVFLTTSTFTKDARDAAMKARGSLVLVDGARLAAFMMDRGVGVTHETILVPKIDSDYFEDS